MADRQQTAPQAIDTPQVDGIPSQMQDSGFQMSDRFETRETPAGPQLWAVVLTLVGLYYLWTRLLGKSLPRFTQRGGHRIGATGGGGTVGRGRNHRAEVQAARERQQQEQHLLTAARARETTTQATSHDRTSTVRERAKVSVGNMDPPNGSDGARCAGQS